MSPEHIVASRELIKTLRDAGRKQATLVHNMDANTDEALVAQQLLDGIIALISIAHGQQALMVNRTIRNGSDRHVALSH